MRLNPQAAMAVSRTIAVVLIRSYPATAADKLRAHIFGARTMLLLHSSVSMRPHHDMQIDHVALIKAARPVA